MNFGIDCIDVVSGDCINGGVYAWNLGDRSPKIKVTHGGGPGIFWKDGL